MEWKEFRQASEGGSGGGGLAGLLFQEEGKRPSPGSGVGKGYHHEPGTDCVSTCVQVRFCGKVRVIRVSPTVIDSEVDDHSFNVPYSCCDEWPLTGSIDSVPPPQKLPDS